MIQGVLPLVSISPIAFVIFFNFILKLDVRAAWTRQESIIGYDLLDYAVTLIIWNGFFDGVTTLFLMKQYRDAICVAWKQLKKALLKFYKKLTCKI